MVIWNREVTSILTDLKFEKNLVNLISKIMKKYLNFEVNSILAANSPILHIQKNKSDPGKHNQTSGGKIKIPEDTPRFSTDSIDLRIEQSTDNVSEYNGWIGSKDQNYYNHSLTCGLGIDSNLFCHNEESKETVLDEVYKFEFQANYFLEQ